MSVWKLSLLSQISNSGNSGLTAVGRVERRHWHFRKIWQNPDLLPQWNLPSWPRKDQRWSENQIRWICVILRYLCQSWVCVSVTQCQPRELLENFWTETVTSSWRWRSVSQTWRWNKLYLYILDPTHPREGMCQKIDKLLDLLVTISLGSLEPPNISTAV